MKDIKFRAWDEQGKEMVCFKNEKLVDDQHQMQHLAHLINGDYGNVLMQYTGLKDKNGVEIYEGDIVSCEYLAPDERYVAIGEVVWCNSDSAQYKVNDNFNESDPLQEWHSGCEVIGNIYENPELLKAPN